MSEATKSALEKILPQLKCHFTWNLFKEGTISTYMEERVLNQIEFLSSEFKSTMYNMLAYIKHIDGDNEAALECLKKAEALQQEEQDSQSEIRSLVTWGNYAWVHYHMGQFSEAQDYVDKVTQVCKKFANPYSLECPELDCEEGWTRLQCGRNERAKVCFQRALEEKPDDSEFASGLAIAVYYLDGKFQNQFSVDALKEALELSPKNQYLKILLAQRLQKIREQDKGQKLVEEALAEAPGQTDILRNAAVFYRNMGKFDKASELFLRALASTENNSHIYYHVMSAYRKFIQMQDKTERGTSGTRQKIEELKALIMDYISKALDRKPSPLNAYSDLIDFPEVESCYQIVFDEEPPSAEERELYGRYRDLLEKHRKSEDPATQNCFERFPISN